MLKVAVKMSVRRNCVDTCTVEGEQPLLGSHLLGLSWTLRGAGGCRAGGGKARLSHAACDTLHIATTALPVPLLT